MKDELKDLDIPQELHARAMRGIAQAAQEQSLEKSTFPRHWLPRIGSIAFTVAALLFIWLSAFSTSEKKSFTATASDILPVAMDVSYILAGIITLCVTGIALFVMKKKYFPKKWLALTVLAIYSIIWNQAYYEAQQLEQPEIMPLYVEINDSFPFMVQYVTNKYDERYIRQLTIGEANPYHFIAQEIDEFQQPYPNTYAVGQTNHHDLKQATFIMTPDDVAMLMSQENDWSQAYVTFTDGTTQPMTIHLPVDSPMVNSIRSDEERTDVSRINETWTIESIALPKGLENQLFYELAIDGDIIKNETIDLLPYTVQAKQYVKLTYHMTRNPDYQVSYNGSIFFLKGQGKYLRLGNLDDVPPFTPDSIQQIINKQRGEKHD